MKQFYETYAGNEKLSPLVREISWTNNLLIMMAAKSDLTPGRYVGTPEQEDDGEPFEEKMARLTGELSELWKEQRRLEDEIRERLGAMENEEWLIRKHTVRPIRYLH